MASPLIVLFGATGDLAKQKLFPALQALYAHNKEDAATIISIGRKPYDNESFRVYLTDTLKENAEGFLETVSYYQLDMLEDSQYEGLKNFLDSSHLDSRNQVFYLAIPPEHYQPVLGSIASHGLTEESISGFKRLVIEKPFGQDLVTARALNDFIQPLFKEEQIYRIDHYLGKETVQNILAFRFANRLFESLWNTEAIDHIQITVAEDEGIRNRGPYYEQAGAFRDVLQNHVLQLLAITCMEEPTSFNFEEFSKHKEDVLKNLAIQPQLTVIGQYEGYKNEVAVSPDSQTETYAMAGFTLNLPRWKDTPIYMRTGKMLAKKVSEISIQFKEPVSRLFSGPTEELANVLTFRLQPDEGISLRMQVKTPRERMAVLPVRMEFCYGQTFKQALPDAYELVFQDVLKGERIHTLSAGVIEESWRLIDSLKAQQQDLDLTVYAAGSWGPAAADTLLEKEGRRWLAHENEICNGVIMESTN